MACQSLKTEIQAADALSMLDKVFFFLAKSTASLFFERYAPLPDFFPVKSIDTSPSFERTMRTSSFFGFISPVATHLRIGTFFLVFIRHPPHLVI